MQTIGIAVPWQIYFQNIYSPSMLGIVHFHDDVMAIMFGILVSIVILMKKLFNNFSFFLWIGQVYNTLIHFSIVRKLCLYVNTYLLVNIKNNNSFTYSLFLVIYSFLGKFYIIVKENTIILFLKKNVFNFFLNKYPTSTWLEIIWTIFPGIVLIFIGVPSFALLYALDECFDPVLTIHAVGHQWYWSYENYDFPKVSFNFDSYMVPDEDLTIGGFRLLEVDKALVVPTSVNVRILTSSTDVLHSWAIPSLGIKMDACPGRLNQTPLFIDAPGIYYGQCSEICGVNHGFMPIVVKAVELSKFYNLYSIKN